VLKELHLASPAFKERPSSEKEPDALPPVFQRLEFLLRDAVVQHVSDSGRAATTMAAYLSEVFVQTKLEDLRTIREQILSCFEHTSCYMLPHPGFEVVENAAYDGKVSTIRENFRIMLERYVHIVFSEQLEPKRVMGREVTAPQLGNFIRGYARVFKESSRFPEAKVLFNAIADANNKSAKDAALSCYTKALAAVTAHGSQHVPAAALRAEDAQHTAAALSLFDSSADFGPQREIRRYRADLQQDLAELSADLMARNKALEPGMGIAEFSQCIGLWVALGLLRWLLDMVCSPWLDACKRASSAVGFLQTLAVFTLAYMLYTCSPATKKSMSDVATAVVGAASAQMTAAAAAQPALAAAAGAAAGAGGGAGSSSSISSGSSAVRQRPGKGSAAKS